MELVCWRTEGVLSGGISLFSSLLEAIRRRPGFAAWFCFCELGLGQVNIAQVCDGAIERTGGQVVPECMVFSPLLGLRS
jgi:hypothetical protein